MSSYAPSIANSAISIKMRNFAMQGKPVIDISLNGESSYVTSFSTMDKLEGEVSVTAPHDTRFDDIEIAFVGTYLFSPAEPQPTNPYHRPIEHICRQVCNCSHHVFAIRRNPPVSQASPAHRRVHASNPPDR